jgi:methenyltetrahydromethanopterin cyclohydrolase
LVERLLGEAAAFGVEVHRLSNGTRVVDAGVQSPGGFGAGKVVAQICLGGLADVSLVPYDLGGLTIPAVSVAVDRPVIACMASQYAGWKVSIGKFFGMGSGPARAVAAAEKLYDDLGYRDVTDQAVLVLETDAMPTEEVAAYVAGKCGLAPEQVTLVVASTTSMVGGIQIAARSVETAMHKMMEVGFHLEKVQFGSGVCPIATPIRDTLRAIGRTNDCVLYGATAALVVEAADEEIQQILDQIPSSASRDYGTPFYELFKRYGDFYKIDPMLFSPACVTITNVATGRTFFAGRLNLELLRKSLCE